MGLVLAGVGAGLCAALWAGFAGAGPGLVFAAYVGAGMAGMGLGAAFVIWRHGAVRFAISS